MILPYDDINPTERTPFVCWALIAVNVILHGYLVMVLVPSVTPEALQQMRWSYEGCRPDVRLSGASVQQAYLFLIHLKYGLVPENLYPSTFLSSMFLHGGLGHLLGNMLFLWITGDNLEDRFGHTSFLGLYLLSGLAAAFAQVAVTGSDCRPMIGASGAIAGVMGGYLFLFPKSKIKILFFWFPLIHTFYINAFWWLGLWIFFQVLSGSAVTSGGGVAYWAHIGGFAAGLGMAVVAWGLGWVEGGVNLRAQRRTRDSKGGRSPGAPWEDDHRRRGPW